MHNDERIDCPQYISHDIEGLKKTTKVLSGKPLLSYPCLVFILGNRIA